MSRGLNVVLVSVLGFAFARSPSFRWPGRDRSDGGRLYPSNFVVTG